MFSEILSLPADSIRISNPTLGYHYATIFDKERLIIDFWHPANFYPMTLNYYGITGIYQTPPGYYVDETEAEEFDKTFPPKVKLTLPGQLF